MKIQLDLFKLCNEDDNKEGRIRALFNPELRKEIRYLVKEIKSKDVKLKEIAEELGTTYTTLWDYLVRTKSIPLDYIRKIVQIWSRTTGNSHEKKIAEIQKMIKRLSYGSGPQIRSTNAVKELSRTLCKILGAHAADGSMRKRYTKWGGKMVPHYEIRFREEYEDNIKALTNWINKIFDINVKPKDKKNHWYIYISNKILFRYFHNIFGFPNGRKCEIVEMPHLVRNSSKGCKKAFVTGVLMFDGSVERKTGYVSLFCKSKPLVSDVSSILMGLKIEPDYINLEPDKYGRFRFIIRKKEKRQKILKNILEPQTTKWLRLRKTLN